MAETKQVDKNKKKGFIYDFKKNWKLHLVFIPVFLFFLIFSYLPMFGILVAFMDYTPLRGFEGSTWVDFQNFVDLFTDESFGRVMRNTTVMALLNLTVGYAMPVLFALLLSEVKFKYFKKPIQVASYMPNFIAPVVVCGLVTIFLASDGPITLLCEKLGFIDSAENMLMNPKYFWTINTVTNIWQGMGYGAIVFTAAIMNVNADLHEAAAIDGAGRLKRMLHVTLPSILPMIITMFILRVGLIFTTGFDNILLLYGPQTYDTADVISSFVYRKSMGGGNQYGFSAAAGLFQSLIATFLLVASNFISSRLAKTSLY